MQYRILRKLNRVSSSAQADDPVIADADNCAAALASTEFPAFAGNDNKYRSWETECP